jgi:tRNA (mo5U34)-methyltransferase
VELFEIAREAAERTVVPTAHDRPPVWFNDHAPGRLSVFWNRKKASREDDLPRDPAAVRAAVEKIKWWHPIDLGSGVVTPGIDVTPARLAEIRMPADLTGLTVLDIGAWDGFFSFEAERRGARRVLATDSFCWDGGGWGTKKGFELARRVLDSRVEDKWIEVLDLSPETVGVFDVVLFLGILYHMKHPLLALERVASVTSRQLIMQTQVDMLPVARPALAFYPGNELGGDPTNWFAPNPAALEAMLETVGFRKIEILSKSFPDNVPLDMLETVRPNHVTLHAWK